ncbi:MAG: Uma2 family endonuclease [Treponemataceae bacterium]|nr:MAG: Uma2 family endonuclease [Treponemataceae bacterium]
MCYTIGMSQAVLRKTEEVSADGRLTYADYIALDSNVRGGRGGSDVRYELIDGKMVKMLASASTAHQRVAKRLLYQFETFLKGKKCEVFQELDLRLFPAPDESDDTVYIPDLMVVCDAAKIGAQGCSGAPTLVIEILSPSTQAYDEWIKYRNYQKAGVAEYWIVDPENKMVKVCILKDGSYSTLIYEAHEAIDVSVLSGCRIALTDIFADPL